MKYVHIYSDEQGCSHFADVDVSTSERHVVDGVPPLLLSDAIPVSAMAFVEQRPGAHGWEPHVAPRRSWVIALSGRAAITVSAGERREFGPGEPILIEDTEGEGHISTPLSEDFAFVMIHLPDRGRNDPAQVGA